MTIAAPATTNTFDLRKLQPYGKHGWMVWESGLLRSTGFPAEGLDHLATPDLLQAADEALSKKIDEKTFAKAYEQASATTSAEISRIAEDPHLALALGWQNPPLLRMAKKLRLPADRLNSSRRSMERRLAMYWQRYCGKADTIGSFGPFAWVRISGNQGFGKFHHGPELATVSHPSFEAWMVAELGTWIAAREGVTEWLPVALEPMLHLDEFRSVIIIPGKPPLKLRSEEVAVLRLADGSRSTHAIAIEAAKEIPENAVRKILEKFSRKRILTRGPAIPISVDAWQVLRNRVAGIRDEPLREELNEILDRFELLLAEVGAAKDEDELMEALSRLDTQFLESTGRQPTREAGNMYAGRTLCYFDACRDVEWELGSGILDSLDDALSLLLRSADWFATRLYDSYSKALSDLALQLSSPNRPLRLSDMWKPSLSLFWGDKTTPLQDAVTDLSRRWASILDQFAADDSNRRELRSEELAAAVAAAFPKVQAPAGLGIHSPDLQFIADNPEALSQGEFIAVLGELHACFASLDIPAVEWSVPGGSIRERINDALGLERLVPLFPESWRRNTGRVVTATSGSQDRLLGFTRAVSHDRSQVWPMASLEVVEGSEGFELFCPDGRHVPLAQAWIVPISMVAADAFKVGLGGAHTPRLSIDRLVLFRETWRPSTDDIEIHTRRRREADYLAVRSWQKKHGLPDEVFVKFADEVKPTYLHFGSVPLVASFISSVRQQRARSDEDHRIVISECLPRPQESWLMDRQGNRYVSEVRLQIIKESHPEEIKE